MRMLHMKRKSAQEKGRMRSSCGLNSSNTNCDWVVAVVAAAAAVVATVPALAPALVVAVAMVAVAAVDKEVASQ